jgi:hypothetical protein
VSEQVEMSPNQMFLAPVQTLVADNSNQSMVPQLDAPQSMPSYVLSNKAGAQTDKLEAQPTKEIEMEDDEDSQTDEEEEDGEAY